MSGLAFSELSFLNSRKRSTKNVSQHRPHTTRKVVPQRLGPTCTEAEVSEYFTSGRARAGESTGFKQQLRKNPAERGDAVARELSLAEASAGHFTSVGFNASRNASSDHDIGSGTRVDKLMPLQRTAELSQGRSGNYLTWSQSRLAQGAQESPEVSMLTTHPELRTGTEDDRLEDAWILSKRKLHEGKPKEASYHERQLCATNTALLPGQSLSQKPSARGDVQLLQEVQELGAVQGPRSSFLPRSSIRAKINEHPQEDSFLNRIENRPVAAEIRSQKEDDIQSDMARRAQRAFRHHDLHQIVNAVPASEDESTSETLDRLLVSVQKHLPQSVENRGKEILPTKSRALQKHGLQFSKLSVENSLQISRREDPSQLQYEGGPRRMSPAKHIEIHRRSPDLLNGQRERYASYELDNIWLKGSYRALAVPPETVVRRALQNSVYTSATQSGLECAANDSGLFTISNIDDMNRGQHSSIRSHTSRPLSCITRSFGSQITDGLAGRDRHEVSRSGSIKGKDFDDLLRNLAKIPSSQKSSWGAEEQIVDAARLEDCVESRDSRSRYIEERQLACKSSMSADDLFMSKYECGSIPGREGDRLFDPSHSLVGSTKCMFWTPNELY